MANIIIAWEYERDYVHILRLQSLQNTLSAQGHCVYLIGPTLPPSMEKCFLPAPRMHAPTLHKPRSITKIGGFSDRLTLFGFNNATSLTKIINVWENYFQLLKPALLILDSAPTATLAAYQQIPCIQLSDGFSLPPLDLTEFPRMRPDAPPLAATDHLLKVVHTVQAKRRKPLPRFLPELFNSDYVFINHLPEFDPYCAFRKPNQIACGPLMKLPAHQHSNQQKYYFAYLDINFHDIESIIIGLTDFDKKGIFFIPYIPQALRQFILSTDNIVLDEFPNLNDIFSDCACVIHHGNVSVAEAAYSAGIPQIVLPDNVECEWIGETLIKHRVGISIISQVQPIESTRDAMEYAMGLKEWATLRAQHLQQQSKLYLESQLLNACNKLIA